MIGKTRTLTPRQRLWLRYCSQRGSLSAISILTFVSFLAIAAPWLPLADPSEVATEKALAPPSLTIESGESVFPPICGRDALGRDLFARIIFGARISLLTALAAAAVSLLIGVTWGAIAGFAGGAVDQTMMRTVDALTSLPFLFIVIFFISVARGFTFLSGPSAQLIVFLVTLGSVYWLTMARVVHGQVLSLKEREFVESARALGARPSRVLFRHLVPQLTPTILVTLTLTIPKILLMEAFLSFLGLGIQAPQVSWGLLARDAFEVLTPIHAPWWLILFPSVAIVLTLGALQWAGDALQSAWSSRSGTLGR